MPIQCDCEVYEICPSCAPDEPTYAKAAAANDKAVRRRQSYKGPINGPCSACGDGDTAMEYHDHEPPSPSYTLADLRVLAHGFLQTSDSGIGTDGVEMRLKLSIFLAWLARKEREANERHL